MFIKIVMAISQKLKQSIEAIVSNDQMLASQIDGMM